MDNVLCAAMFPQLHDIGRKIYLCIQGKIIKLEKSKIINFIVEISIEFLYTNDKFYLF